jgi:hypothetical protein
MVETLTRLATGPQTQLYPSDFATVFSQAARVNLKVA